jgi:hypothetical protein
LVVGASSSRALRNHRLGSRTRPATILRQAGLQIVPGLPHQLRAGSPATAACEIDLSSRRFGSRIAAPPCRIATSRRILSGFGTKAAAVMPKIHTLTDN